MLKFFKRLFITLLVLCFVLILGIASIIYFVNPNDFRGTIESQVLAQTGHVLTIKGPMAWKCTPNLMLELQDVQLDNQKPFQNELLTAKNIRLDLALASLFTGKIVLNVKLNEPNIVLLKDKTGQSNWETLLKPKGQPATNANTHDNPPSQTEGKISAKDRRTLARTHAAEHPLQQENNIELPSKSQKRLLLNSIKIEDGQVTFHDESKNSHYQIKDIQLSLNNITAAALGIKNPLKLSLQWLNLKDPKAFGKLALNADWKLDLSRAEMNIPDMTLKLELPEEKISTISGKVNIKNLSHHPKITGEIESKNFEIKPWLSVAQRDNPAIPSSANIKANFHYLAPYLELEKIHIQLKDNGTLSSNLKINTSKVSAAQLDLQGELIAHQLLLNKIKLDEIKGNIDAKGGIVNINPLTIRIAQSLHQASLQMDLRGNTPKYLLKDEAKNFEIKQLLTQFGVENKLEGKTSFKINLNAAGNTADELRHSLSGNSNIEIQNGKFSGVDLVALLQNLNSNIYSLISGVAKKQGLNINLGASLQALQNLWQQKQTAVNPNSATPFNSLKASLNINNGVAYNPDLLISQTEYTIKGKGKIDLNNSTLDYQTAAQLNKNPYPANDEVANYLYSSSLPIVITGSLGHLSVLPDIKTYANNAFAFAQKNLVQKTVQQEASKVINNAIGKSIDKGADKNVDKAIENTLNSLFEKVGN